MTERCSVIDKLLACREITLCFAGQPGWAEQIESENLFGNGYK